MVFMYTYPFSVVASSFSYCPGVALGGADFHHAQSATSSLSPLSPHLSHTALMSRWVAQSLIVRRERSQLSSPQAQAIFFRLFRRTRVAWCAEPCGKRPRQRPKQMQLRRERPASSLLGGGAGRRGVREVVRRRGGLE